MKRKIFVGLVLLVASGYMMDICFTGMNKANDLTYAGGILGLCLWLFAALWIYKFLTKDRIKKEKESHEKQSRDGDDGSTRNRSSGI